MARLAFQARLFGWGLAYWLRSSHNHARLRLRGRPAPGFDYRTTGRVLAHALGLRRLGWVSYGQSSGEGAGSQLFWMLAARALARGLGVPYAHRPFAALDHAEGDAAEFARGWEVCLNFGLGELPLAQAAGPGLDVLELNDTPLWNPRLLAWLKAGIPAQAADLRARFRHARRPPARGERLRVAVHLRRGDVSVQRSAHMFTPASQVRATAEAIVAVLAELGLAHDLEIVSQGRPEDFAELAGLACTLVLDEPAQASFARLAEADVLVAAKSRYSYFAGLICDGVVLYETPPVLPPGEGWLAVTGGRFDASAFAARVRALRPAGLQRASNTA